MFNSTRKFAMALAATTVLTGPTMLMADGVGSAVRDAAVANAGRTQALVPCPRLNRNIPASLASEMDCGRAVPLVAGERVRNTGGGLFGGHRIGSAPPANNDDDTPFSVPESTPPSGGTPPTDGGTPPTDGGTPPTDGGTPPTDGGTPPTDGGTPPTDGGTPPTDGGGGQTKAERFDELGLTFDDIGTRGEDFQESFDNFIEENGPNGDWSSFNPPL